MKKIIFIFSLILFFVGQNAFGSFNNASNDCPTITVSNVTTGYGTNPNINGCEPYTSMNANSGEEIAVSIYYHNTGSTPANNVRVSLSKNPNSGVSNTHSFYATISSDNGSAQGSGQVYINSQTDLQFQRAVWQPNQGRSNVSFPSGQNGSQVLSGGVNIGTINPGWNTQGYVIVYFRVGNSTINPPIYPPIYPPQNNNCVIDSFRVNDDEIEEGDSVVFYWETTGCSYTTLTTFSQNMTQDGSRRAYPDRSRNYCLNAYGNGNDQECVYVEVDEENDYEDTDLEVDTNNATNIGINYATLNGYIDPDGEYSYRWFRYGTSSSSLNRTTNRVNNGYNANNFSAYISNLSPNTRYYFQAVGENSDGDIEYGQTKNFNTNAEIVDEKNMSAVTTVATGVTTSSAVLNGIVLNDDNLNTNAYFEYGKTLSLGSRTNIKSLGSGSSLSSFDSISGLSPNTIYYFRIVGENSNGISYGDIKIFNTLSSGVKPPVNPGTPKTKEEALATIDISNRYEFVRENDVIDYVVTYKNTGKTKLENSILQVYLPKEVEYTNSSRGNFNNTNNELLVYLEDLNPNDEGVVYIQGRVVNMPENYPQIATTAMLVYTNENKLQENVMDTVLNRVNQNTNSNSLAASAFFAWLGSLSLCFWLFLIILILLAILFSKIYRKEKVYNYPKEEARKDTHIHLE